MSAIESFYDNDSLRFINDSAFKVWIKQSEQHNGDMANYFGEYSQHVICHRHDSKP
jgi:hypothetical protein